MKKNVVIILAKGPDPAYVKTRLRGYISDSERIGLYISMLETTIGRLNNISGADTVISYAPPESAPYFRRFGLEILSQVGADVGQRMYHAIETMLGRGYGKAVLVGVDIPALTGEIISEAFEQLDSSDVVFGPASDGGYYLVGMKEPIAGIFADVQWSSHTTLQETLGKVLVSGYSVSLLEILDDIDTIQDLRRSGVMTEDPGDG